MKQRRENEMSKSSGRHQHTTLKGYNQLMPVKCLESLFPFYIPSDLKQFFYVTNNVNMCFEVTPSLPLPSFFAYGAYP